MVEADTDGAAIRGAGRAGDCSRKCCGLPIDRSRVEVGVGWISGKWGHRQIAAVRFQCTVPIEVLAGFERIIGKAVCRVGRIGNVLESKLAGLIPDPSRFPRRSEKYKM